MTLQRTGHKSHVSSRSVSKFLQKIGFQEFQDDFLKEWLNRYSKDREKKKVRQLSS